MTFMSFLPTEWGGARSLDGWKMKYMVIRTHETHLNLQEWERKEKQNSPIFYEENTQKAYENAVTKS